jgi:hypothetical protein
VVATFNTFILGALATLLQGISSRCGSFGEWSGISPLWLLLSAVPAAASILFSAWAVFPYLQSEDENRDNSSLIFFQRIAERNADDYLQEISSVNLKELEEDLASQIYSVSRAANLKFCRLRVSIILLGIAALLLLCLYPFYVI